MHIAHSRWSGALLLAALAGTTLTGAATTATGAGPAADRDTSSSSGAKAAFGGSSSQDLTERRAGGALLYKAKTFRLRARSAGGGLVKCGKPNYRAVGGGVQTPTLREVVNETRPWDSPSGDNVPDNGWIAYVINPASERIKYRVYVICQRG